MSVPPIRRDEMLRVLQRAKQRDPLGRKIAAAMALIEGVLDELGEPAVALSFNGGKDCTVLLHLFAAVLLARHTSLPFGIIPSHAHPALPPVPHPLPNEHPSTTDAFVPLSPPPGTPTLTVDPITGPTIPPPPLPETTSSFSAPSSQPKFSDTPPSATHHPPRSPHPYPPIKSIYITAPNPFPSLDTFVLDSAERYGLDLYRFGGGMKAALEEYLGCGGGRGVKGVLVGTRRSDPNGDVPELAPTDPSWPAFLRIHPILSWSYADIWAFLRELDVHWCHLYDEGYTSLGSTTNTVPNPLLRNPSAPGGWDPAWKLQDEMQERAGRLDSSS